MIFKRYKTKWLLLIAVLWVAGCAQEVKFDDRNLEAAIRETIGKDKGAITDRDLRKIIELKAPDNKIRDITGIEECANLKILILGANEETGWQTSNEIEDFSPLKGLKKLVYLNLNGSKISDYGPLTNYRNVISDVTPLSNLTNLKTLLLSNNRIADPSPLAKLRGLETLDLSHNPIGDFAFLSKLANLTSLCLDNAEIDNDDLAALLNAPNLNHLELNRNQISDLTPLASLTSLESLKLSDNQISDVRPLSSLTSLTTLELRGNQISNVSALSGLNRLSGLNLRENIIGDIRPLAENAGLGEGDEAALEGNSLDDEAYEIHIPDLEKRGVRLRVDGRKAVVRTWDTLSPLTGLDNRGGWKVIPAGTNYSPRGDLVLENGYLTAAFYSKSGKVAIYAKSGEKRAEIVPLKGNSAASFRVLENTDDRADISVSFAVLSFSRDQVIRVAPVEDVSGVRIVSPMEYGILPSFISDDLIFSRKDYPDAAALHIPSENLFVGLLSGENSMLAVTWPSGNQKLRLIPGDGGIIESVEIDNDGKSLYLAVLNAPGIWHREELKPSHLQKDVTIEWERPFSAKWITQLYEDKVKTTYTFVDSNPEGFWRAGIGWCAYPVRFDGTKAIYHLSKKIPPKGESLIYSLERKNTPASVSTFADIMRQTLDGQTCESITDPEGRMTRSLTRPNCAIGNATCHVTDRLKIVFEAGEEVEESGYVKNGAEDMVYFLAKQRERALEYQQFAREMVDFLTLTRKENPGLESFLDEVENITEELLAEFEYEKDNIKDAEYTKKLAAETRALTRQTNPDNLAAFMKLKGQWTGAGSAVDDLNRKLNTIARKLFQQAGYRCADQPESVKIAEEIRRRTIKCLRNPGRFEIWSNY